VPRGPLGGLRPRRLRSPPARAAGQCPGRASTGQRGWSTRAGSLPTSAGARTGLRSH
jgi:hypothetical protein